MYSIPTLVRTPGDSLKYSLLLYVCINSTCLHSVKEIPSRIVSEEIVNFRSFSNDIFTTFRECNIFDCLIITFG